MNSRFLRFPGGKAKVVTLSYDDGVVADKRLMEIMKKNGLKGTFNISYGCFTREENIPNREKIPGRLSYNEAKALYVDDDFEIACHGYNHPHLAMCDTAVACGQVLNDRIALEEMFGKPIHGMAYPFGSVNDDVAEICRLCGIWYSRVVKCKDDFGLPNDWLRLTPTSHHNNPKLMEMADNFINLKPTFAPRMFFLWGHSYEFDRNDNWNVIEEFAQKIGNHDDIWYATNMELYLAWRDFHQLESSADGNSIFNPTCRTVWFADRPGNLYKVEPGETLHI